MAGKQSDIKKKAEIVPWHQIGELEEMERRFDHLFRDPFRFPSLSERLPRGIEWMPNIDIFERGNKLIVKADLPGMEQNDIEVTVVGDTLRIKGEKKTESEVKEKDYYRSERSYGSFSRNVPLPFAVDPDKVAADYDNGVLEITIPKPVEAKTAKVPVGKKKGKNTGK